ncbi:MAG TPA: hypothetical protein VGB46_05780 [Flavisolibacter sp.]|jgi:hypothetical protein
MHKLLLAFLLIGHFAFGQKDSLVKVPGTRCSLVPPEAFVAATEFSGFLNEEVGASIIVTEVGMPYQQVQGMFTAEVLKQKGMTFVGKKTVDFNMSKAILVKGTQKAHGIIYIKQVLVFGDEEETVIVSSTYPESFKSIEGKIIDAMFSTVHNKSETLNLHDAVPFALNVEGTDFKVERSAGEMLVYSIEAEANSPHKRLLAVASLTRNVAGPDRKRYAEEKLKKDKTLQFDKVREINEITVDGLKGYEIVADAKSKELLYQVILFEDSGGYYLILGIGSNFGSHLDTYRKLARTFKRKQPRGRPKFIF